jgi:predicted TIM-barrel fold metal-dependent hydrolase
MIVDSQVHLWRAESPERPWPPGGAERAHSLEPMTYEKMLGMMDEAGVDCCVIVPPSWEGDRNDYGLEAASKHPDRFAVMGRIALDDPKGADLVSHWRDQPGMAGIRLTFMGGQTRWLEDGTADWFWRSAAKASVPVMVHAPGKTAVLGEIARRHPDLALIFDHMALNHKMAEDGRCAEGVTALVALAGLPNVHVKVSSTPTYSRVAYPFPDMDEHIKRIVDAFGPGRCFWGTDYTHSPEKCSYAKRKTHFTEHLDFLTPSEKKLIMGDALMDCLWRQSH